MSVWTGDDQELPPGTAVGEYVVEQKLGEGAFGKVYRAVHPVIAKEAAIKVLSRSYSADPQVVSRFVAEARAVNQIGHPNIIDIFSFGQLDDGRHYYIMELLEGAPLDVLLHRRGRLGLEEALPILRGIARALDAAHAKGVLHRDLKPANVFVQTGEGAMPEAKLLDFGIAKLLRPSAADRAAGSDSHRTAAGTPMGTPHYMSPEQCRGEEVDARTDLYSFGVLIFQVLTGHLPFTAAHTVEVLFLHMQAPAPAPSSLEPSLEPRVDQTVAWLLAKRPEERPRSAAEAISVLTGAAILESRAHRPRSGPQQSAMAPPLLATMAPVALGEERLPVPRTPRWLWALLLASLLIFALGLAVRSEEPDVLSGAAQVPKPAPDPPVPPAREAPPPVRVQVEGTPAGAEVYADGGLRLGAVPLELSLERSAQPMRLELRAKGYRSKTETVIPSSDVRLSVALEKLPPPRSTKGARKKSDDIEEAF